MVDKIVFKPLIVFGEHSFIKIKGVETNPPFTFGNYIELRIDEPLHQYDRVTVLNMTFENIDAVLNGWIEDETWLRHGVLQDKRAWITLWTENDRHCCLINDGRIKKPWYRKTIDWYWYRPSVELATAVYKEFGDPMNDLEQFTNPAHYWVERGRMIRTHEEGKCIIV